MSNHIKFEMSAASPNGRVACSTRVVEGPEFMMFSPLIGQHRKHRNSRPPALGISAESGRRGSDLTGVQPSHVPQKS